MGLRLWGQLLHKTLKPPSTCTMEEDGQQDLARLPHATDHLHTSASASLLGLLWAPVEEEEGLTRAAPRALAFALGLL